MIRLQLMFAIIKIIDYNIYNTFRDNRRSIMTKEFEDKGNTYTIHESANIGEVRVADEVIAIIAGLAATEIDGVESMAGNITNELVSKLGMKNLSKGVRVKVEESLVTVDVSLNIKYGYEIPEVSAKVQEKVKSAIETMTGLQVCAVNIKIAGVNIEA